MLVKEERKQIASAIWSGVYVSLGAILLLIGISLLEYTNISLLAGSFMSFAGISFAVLGFYGLGAFENGK